MVARLFQYKILRPVWLVLRVWLGIQWFNAGYHKLTDAAGAWVGSRAGEAIKGFWMKVAGVNEAFQPVAEPLTKYVWYRNFIIELLKGHRERLFSFLITYGELLAGVGLVLGAFTVLAALGGAFMNLNYLLADTASANGLMYTAAIMLILAGMNAGYYGLDYFLMKLYKKYFAQNPFPKMRV